MQGLFAIKKLLQAIHLFVQLDLHSNGFGWRDGHAALNPSFDFIVLILPCAQNTAERRSPVGYCRVLGNDRGCRRVGL